MTLKNFAILGKKIVGTGLKYRAGPAGSAAESCALGYRDLDLFIKPTSAYVSEPKDIQLPEASSASCNGSFFHEFQYRSEY